MRQAFNRGFISIYGLKTAARPKAFTQMIFNNLHITLPKKGEYILPPQ